MGRKNIEVRVEDRPPDGAKIVINFRGTPKQGESLGRLIGETIAKALKPKPKEPIPEGEGEDQE